MFMMFLMHLAVARCTQPPEDSTVPTRWIAPDGDLARFGDRIGASGYLPVDSSGFPKVRAHIEDPKILVWRRCIRVRSAEAVGVVLPAPGTLEVFDPLVQVNPMCVTDVYHVLTARKWSGVAFAHRSGQWWRLTPGSVQSLTPQQVPRWAQQAQATGVGCLQVDDLLRRP